MINQLKLIQVDSRPAFGRVYRAVIDEKPLSMMFKEFESQFTDTIAGIYTGALFECNIRNQLLTVSHRFFPLAGDVDCVDEWFVTGEVLTYDEFVCWGKWENPRRGKNKKHLGEYWDYRAFPSIVFEKEQYEKAIEGALLG